MSTTLPRKNSTVLAPIDINQQPTGRLIFLLEGASGTQAFSVDEVEVQDEVIYGYRHTAHISVETIVVAVPVRSPWTVLARDAVIFRTLEESMRKTKTDRAQEADLVKEVFGNDDAPAPQAPVVGLQPSGPGHYL